MKSDFEKELSGGHHNSLGNTIEVVEKVLKEPKRFEELFKCYFSDDELVRLRVSNAIKRITKAKKEIVVPYINSLLDEITQINQASTQWTLSSLFLLLEADLNKSQKEKAQSHMQMNLKQHTDWIVLNTTMETLYEWSKKDGQLRKWLVVELDRLKKDTRKSVAKRATKYLDNLLD